MSRSRVVMAVALSGVIPAAPALAGDWFAYTTYVMKRDYRRNACWPSPFIAPARQAVAEPFYRMIDNGWRQQNLIGDLHFRPESSVLTEAGKLKIQIILTQLPPARRVLFVQRTGGSEQTLARVDAVQQEAAKVLPQGVLPQVIETTINPRGTEAHYVAAVALQWLESTPAPRLPAVTRDTE